MVNGGRFGTHKKDVRKIAWLEGVRLHDLNDLEVAYWPDRLMAFGGQLEELSALSTKALWDVLDVMVASSREIPLSGKRVRREGKAQSPE